MALFAFRFCFILFVLCTCGCLYVLCCMSAGVLCILPTVFLRIFRWIDRHRVYIYMYRRIWSFVVTYLVVGTFSFLMDGELRDAGM
jgi:hypothetical protein